MNNYDVIIVGSGPAGIFAALEFLKSRKTSKSCLSKKDAISAAGSALPRRGRSPAHPAANVICSAVGEGQEHTATAS